MKISSIDITPDKVVLLTICAFTIVYLEEKKFKDGQEEEILTKDSKSMLEELKMMGIGNGIVKKLVKLFKSITGIFSIIGKHLNAVTKGFIDMFAYTAILIPIMNGILYIIGKYDLNVDTFLENFMALSMGVGTLIAKNGIISIIDKLKDKISTKDKKEIVDEVDTTVIKKVSDFILDPEHGEMINEQ
jgi:cobalamin biosynthesis Co2+ chelatase CbiK